MGERREILWNVYRSNLNVADVYEAWALLGFAWMTIRIINKELLVKVKGVKHNVRILRHRIDDRSLCEQSKLSMSELEELAKSLQESVGQLTVQGIHAFVLVCFVEAFCGLFLSGCEYYDLKNWVDYGLLVSSRSTAETFFQGAGLIASSCALANIVGVEMKFHKELEIYQPFYKFWGAKILVSFAFVQSVLLHVPPFSALSKTRGSLLFASALCMECFIVALIMLAAWDPEQPIYTEYSRFESSFRKEGNAQPLLDKHGRELSFGVRF